MPAFKLASRAAAPSTAGFVRAARTGARAAPRPEPAGADADALLVRARRWGHRFDDLPAPAERPAPPVDSSTPLQLGRTKRPLSEITGGAKSASESESESESESDLKDDPVSEPEEEEEKKEGPNPFDVSSPLFGQMTGRASIKGASFRPPRSYEGRREEQLAKHFTTLLRTAGEHYAKKNKGATDPIEVQSSYIGGNLYMSTNSSAASKDLVDLVTKGGGAKKVLEGVKEPVKPVRKPAHKRFQSKLKKAFADTRQITGTDPEDVKRAQETLAIMKGSAGFTYLDTEAEDFDEQLADAKKESGKVYVVPGEKHAELNVAEFREKHLSDVDDDRAKTYGSKRNCATCYSEMQTKHPEMASGQLPGLLVRNQIPAISPDARQHLYDYMSDNPLNVTLLQHDRQDTGTASDSDTDDEGTKLAKIPSRETKVPGESKKKKQRR